MKIKKIKQLTQNINRLGERIKKARREGTLDTEVLERQQHQLKVFRGALLHIWPGGKRQ